jgi:hypothetical protein
MELSATLCRIQEALHRDRAAKAELANVRTIAEEAATAWGIAAEAAEGREARRGKTRAAADLTVLHKRRLREALPG